MRIRRVDAHEWERWREMRLAMLQDAPYAYGSTYAVEVTRDDAEWQARAARFAAEETPMYVAEEDGAWLACAGGYLEEGIPNVAAVWTRPEARGRGYADACVRAVVEWARRTGAAEVRLWATDTNDAAKRVYARLGFVPNGNTQPLPSDPDLGESEYTLAL